LVLPLSPSCPPQDLEGPFIEEAPPKTFPKGSKMAQKGSFKIFV